MKKRVVSTLVLCLIFLFEALCWQTTAATVTGQWDFKFGDLRATIGADLEYFGDTSNYTTFPLMDVDGQTTRVMAFSNNSTNQGFYLRHGVQPNGGGYFVNQYTLVMDVLFPGNADGQWRALFQTDPSNRSGNDAVFYLGDGSAQPQPNGIGTGGQFDGVVAPDTWNRVVFVVDLTAAPDLQLIKYINGKRAGAQSLSDGLDGQYALGPTALLFTSGINGHTQGGFVSSIQFLSGCLTSNEVAALGGVSVQGISPAQPRMQLTRGSWLSSSMKFSWNGRPDPASEIEFTTNFPSGPWQNLGTLGNERTLTIPWPPTNKNAMFFRANELPSAAQPDIGAPVEADLNITNAAGVIVPTKQMLHAAGKYLFYAGTARPVDMVLSPDGSTAYVKDQITLIVVDTATWMIIQRIRFPVSGTSMHGIVVTKDGSHIYATGAGNEIYDWQVNPDRTISAVRTILMPPNSNPCGLVLSQDENTAYVCLGLNNTLGVVDLPSGTLTSQINVGIGPYAVALSADGRTAFVSDWAGRPVVPGDTTGLSHNTPVVIDDRGIAASGVMSFVDLTNNIETAEVSVGLHPADLKLSPDGNFVYIANANSDTVSVINTQTKTVAETISMRPDARLPFGSACGDLALNASGTLLYVANAGNNAIAIVELPNAQHTNSVITGFIPTDWYPGAICVDSNYLYVVNVKGFGSVNRYSVTMMPTLRKVPLPSANTLAKYTAVVTESGRVQQMLRSYAPPQANVAAVPVPAHTGEPSVFKHVLYVIKENKTYDTLFGDVPQGNGAPSLCTYPQWVTPNHHALATNYVLLDNFYCNGVESFDGHSWVTEGNATDYLEKGFGNYVRSWNQGTDPTIYSSSGFIWNNVLQHGLTFTNYGELSQSFPSPSSTTWLQVYADYTNGAGKIHYNTYYGAPPLLNYSSTNAYGFNLGIPDQVRAANFCKEFNAAQSNGFWPVFNMLYLPGDHTAGVTPGFPTPSAQVADNDLALGKVVDAVTHSIFASNTVIFVIEDDPLGGYDHIDGHRSICLVVSPYTKRHQTISSFYNQTGVLHTMEQIMGLPPMNQMDAMAPLMTACFVNQPDFTPYAVLSNNVPLDTMNPGTFSALKGKDVYWARLSQKLDFSKPDLADPVILNRIVWHSIKGDTRFPKEYQGYHGKGLKKLGLMAIKTGKDDDD